MLEEIVVQAKVSLNISGTNRTTAQIDKVDGVSVCAPEAFEKVERLQKIFNEHRHIRMNIGPALMTVTAKDRQVKHLDRKFLAERGVIPAEGCIELLVSAYE